MSDQKWRPERRRAALAARWAQAQSPVERALVAARWLRGIRKHPHDPAVVAAVDREADAVARRVVALGERLLDERTTPRRGHGK